MATWGQKRQWLILSILLLLLLGAAGTITALALHKAPMCTDGKQNGTEEGVDCGGTCTYLCVADLKKPSVRFATPVFPEQGRTDVIAYIDNSNPEAGVPHAGYTLELLDAQGTVVAEKSGTVNLTPNSTAPIYIPHAYDGSKTVAQAFLTIDPDSIVYPRNYPKLIVPPASEIQIIGGDTSSPKITATLSNPTAHVLYGVTVVITVFDAHDNAIAASRTLVPTLPSQGTAPIVFTWNTAFRAAPVRVEILPATGS